MAETAADSSACKVKNSSVTGIDNSTTTQEQVIREAKQNQVKSRTGVFEDPSLKKELATENCGVQIKDEAAVTPAGPESCEVPCAQSEDGDKIAPDDFLPAGNLCDNMNSDRARILSSDSEPSQKWEKENYPPLRSHRVKEESPDCTTRRPSIDIGVIRGGVGRRCLSLNPMVRIWDPKHRKRAMLALVDNTRRATLIIMAQRCFSGSKFEEAFCEVVAQHPTCRLTDPKKILAASESKYPEVWEFATIRMIEMLPLSTAMEMIHDAEDRIKLEVMRQVNCTHNPPSNKVLLSSIMSMIPRNFKASFPSLRLLCNPADHSTRKSHCEMTVDQWYTMLGRSSGDAYQHARGEGCPRTLWTLNEGIILGMAVALLPSWQLVASCLPRRTPQAIYEHWHELCDLKWLSLTYPDRDIFEKAQRAIEVLMRQCAFKMDTARPVRYSTAANMESELLSRQSIKLEPHQYGNDRFPNGRTHEDTASQDDNGDFLALKRANKNFDASDSKDFMKRPKGEFEDDIKGRPLHLSPYSLTASRKEKVKTGRATKCCRTPRIKPENPIPYGRGSPPKKRKFQEENPFVDTNAPRTYDDLNSSLWNPTVAHQWSDAFEHNFKTQ